MNRNLLRSPAPLLVAIAFANMLAASSAHSQRSKSKDDDYSDKTVSVPDFTITIKLSPQAVRRLLDLHESIKVLAMFDGDPLPGQGHYNAPMRDVYLGSDEKLVDENYGARFDSAKISKRHWDQLENKDFYVTINVFSARKSSKNNLLDCDDREGRVSTFAGRTTEVHCRLIGEPETSTKPR